MDFELSKDKDFVPTSEIRPLPIISGRNRIESPHLLVQDGYIGEDYAARIFYKDRLKRIWRGPPKGNRIFFRGYDILDLRSAQLARESALKSVVTALFESKGWSVYRDPSLMTGKPDLFIKKGNFSFVIELKAYFITVVCREAEIAQAIRYYDELCALKENNINLTANKKDSNGNYSYASMKVDTLPKVLLITSGTLITNDFFDFLQKGTRLEVFNSLVEQRYIELIEKMVDFNTLDQQDAYGIYKHGIRKWHKAGWDHLFSISRFINDQLKVWEDNLETNQSNIILISSDVLLSLLKRENLIQEIKLFELLRKTPLEEIIIDPTVFKV